MSLQVDMEALQLFIVIDSSVMLSLQLIEKFCKSWILQFYCTFVDLHRTE